MDLDLTDEINEILDSEIGSDATLTTASPSGVSSVRVIFTKSYLPVDVADKVNWSGYDIIARGLAENFVNAKQDDTLLVGSVTYRIEDTYETNDGWIYLSLTVPNS